MPLPLARLIGVAAAALTVLCAGTVVLVQPAVAAGFVPINGAGSTWSFNAIAAWDTAEAANGMTVNYQPTGSVTGLQDFAQGIADWAASDIPYGAQAGTSTVLAPARGYAYIPDTAGAIAFVYNLHIAGQRVTNLRLSGAVVAGIFTNQITMWNDPKIAADNPGLTLPAEPIVPVVRTDVAGSTGQFTQWMLATQASSWTAYCAVVGRSPCTQAFAYPVESGTAMVGQSGDLGVTGYVAQATAEGAIGYAEYSYAAETGLPVANVLNAAGYYTAPTPDDVGVSLLQAQIVGCDATTGVCSNPSNNPLYLTQDLSQVYTDTDPRTYELSYYSYLILPTDTSSGFNTSKGYTLGAFGQYLLCQGQQTAAPLGYAPLPINLVEAGFTQLQKIPGNQVPTTQASFLDGCNNPTLSGGADILASSAPMPPACDQQGSTQCAATTITGIETTTTLTASPSPAPYGQPVTLTATVSAADGTTPAGTVQFEVGGTDIGAPVAVNATGVATTTTTFTAPGGNFISAVFTPTSTSYLSSTGTSSLIVSTTSTAAGGLPVAVTVPPTGALTVTVATTPIDLTMSSSFPPLTAAGFINTVSLSDTRNTVPGWSVSGQDTAFTGSGTAAASTIPGDDLGWAPNGTVSGGARVGPAVLPGASPGLADAAQVLASAAPGSGVGTDSLNAVLTLDIPATALPGPYTATLTITYLLTGP